MSKFYGIYHDMVKSMGSMHGPGASVIYKLATPSEGPLLEVPLHVKDSTPIKPIGFSTCFLDFMLAVLQIVIENTHT